MPDPAPWLSPVTVFRAGGRPVRRPPICVRIRAGSAGLVHGWTAPSAGTWPAIGGRDGPIRRLTRLGVPVVSEPTRLTFRAAGHEKPVSAGFSALGLFRQTTALGLQRRDPGTFPTHRGARNAALAVALAAASRVLAPNPPETQPARIDRRALAAPGAGRSCRTPSTAWG